MTDNNPKKSVNDGICKIKLCSSNARARGLCYKHYQRLIKTGTTDPKPDRKGQPCTVDDCDKPIFCKGMCKTHYTQQWKRLHDAMKVRNKK